MLQFGNPRLNGVVDEVGLLVEVQLGHHAVPVGVNGVGGQVQQGGDFLAAEAFGDELQHFPFLPGEPNRGGSALPRASSSTEPGLHDEMGEAELASIVSQKKDAALLAKELVARAVEIDGGDNTTAQVIRVRAVEQVGMYRGRPYRLPI